MRIQDHLIPLEHGHAASTGWAYGSPLSVCMHWTAGTTLAGCRATIGGSSPARKGQASAHYAVGAAEAEGVDRYVDLKNRSWHAGKNQVLTWEGQELTSPAQRGLSVSVGVELVYLGFARKGFPAAADWATVADVDGSEMLVPPWPEEQLEMMVELGRVILARWPDIRPEGWYSHADVCPGYKVDPIGFPFARVLSEIYGETVRDVWTPYLRTKDRQRALQRLDLYRGKIDGDWGSRSRLACSDLQERHQLHPTGLWSVWCGRAAIGCGCDPAYNVSTNAWDHAAGCYLFDDIHIAEPSAS